MGLCLYIKYVDCVVSVIVDLRYLWFMDQFFGSFLTLTVHRHFWPLDMKHLFENICFKGLIIKLHPSTNNEFNAFNIKTTFLKKFKTGVLYFLVFLEFFFGLFVCYPLIKIKLQYIYWYNTKKTTFRKITSVLNFWTHPKQKKRGSEFAWHSFHSHNLN